MSLFNENKEQVLSREIRGKKIEALKVIEEVSTRQRAVNYKQTINYKGGNMFEN